MILVISQGTKADFYQHGYFNGYQFKTCLKIKMHQTTGPLSLYLVFWWHLKDITKIHCQVNNDIKPQIKKKSDQEYLKKPK